MIDFNAFNANIPDEMLAAYIDGNTTESENLLIESSKSEDPMLSEVVDIVNDATSFGSDFNWDLHKGDYGFWELGLPPLVTETDLLVATDSIDDVSTLVDGNSFNEQSMVAFNIVNNELLSCDITDNSDCGEIDDIENFDTDSLI